MNSDRPSEATPTGEVAHVERRPLAWRTNLGLFLVTAVSVFWTGTQVFSDAPTWAERAAMAWPFTVTLLAILLAHEFGHYIAARLHKVDASLPFFIPLPFPVSPFGTMGAVIRMRGDIDTRRALLDIGASGPLAGLVVAIPAYAWGAAHSQLVANTVDAGQLGESILLKTLDYFFGPAVPAGMDLQLSPVAYAAWIGMFITMINLLPIGQLDGGHIAYALLGPRQDKVAPYVHRSLLAFFFVSLASFALRDVRAGFGLFRIGQHVANAIPWLALFEFMAVLGTLSSQRHARSPDAMTLRTRILAVVGLVVIAMLGQDLTGVKGTLLWFGWFVGLGLFLAMDVRWGVLRRHALFDHPVTSAEPLDRVRAAIAVITLAMFVLLFMPAPLTM
ncbi:site-2 protease family protein [Pendulispora brunnea]|uniref:Site-2 protease family protein n=1 Tax=Pendulispora brunnea TaxID=2905690 RepID=A0ABZ2K6Y6_9BACT